MLSVHRFGPEYASLDDPAFIPKYQAACFCGSVRYEVSADPVDAKLCHCRGRADFAWCSYTMGRDFPQTSRQVHCWFGSPTFFQ